MIKVIKIYIIIFGGKKLKEDFAQGLLNTFTKNFTSHRFIQVGKYCVIAFFSFKFLIL